MIQMIILSDTCIKGIQSKVFFTDKYNYVESELITEFKNAHSDGDKRKMKKVAAVLSNFKVC